MKKQGVVELQNLLEQHGPKLFHEFLKIFSGGWFDCYEDDSGIRMQIYYKPIKQDLDDFLMHPENDFLVNAEIISTRQGFAVYWIDKTSIPQIIQDFKRFLKLQVFS